MCIGSHHSSYWTEGMSCSPRARRDAACPSLPGAAGALPARTSAPPEGVTRAMRISNLKVALRVLLTVGLAAAIPPASAEEPPPANRATPSRLQRPSPWGDEKRPFAYSGRVVGPDGKPVAGA